MVAFVNLQLVLFDIFSENTKKEEKANTKVQVKM